MMGWGGHALGDWGAPGGGKVLRRPPGVRALPLDWREWVDTSSFTPIDFDIRRGASCRVRPYIYLVKEGRALPETRLQGPGRLVQAGKQLLHLSQRGQRVTRWQLGSRSRQGLGSANGPTARSQPRHCSLSSRRDADTRTP